MSELNPNCLLEDPLSQMSRLERRNLLIASTIGLLTIHVGLVPTHISALGLEFNAFQQDAFRFILACVVLYMCCAFLIYALSDFFIWIKRRYDYALAIESEIRGWSEDDQEMYDQMHEGVKPIDWYWQKAPVLGWVRICFECALPLVIGAYTFIRLIVQAV